MTNGRYQSIFHYLAFPACWCSNCGQGNPIHQRPGFWTDAGVCIQSHDRPGLGRLTNFCARPPSLIDRLREEVSCHLPKNPLLRTCKYGWKCNYPGPKKAIQAEKPENQEMKDQRDSAKNKSHQRVQQGQGRSTLPADKCPGTQARQPGFAQNAGRG